MTTEQSRGERTIVVGTRQSALALAQTGQMIDELQRLANEQGLNYTFKVHKIVTKGDRILDVTLSKVGGKGLFVKEIEQALLDGVIDLAVHSMKDMPSVLPEGLMNGAVPSRVDPRDALIIREGRGCTLWDLPKGAKVGTSSLRRAAQLKKERADLEIVSIRGNINSRLQKLETEGLDAIVLAAAGLERMGWTDRITSLLPVSTCLPAVGQGALGLECREDDMELRSLLELLNDPVSARVVAAERSFLRVLNGGCQVPIGAYAQEQADGVLRMSGLVGSVDGSVILQETATGTDPEELGKRIGQALIDRGADELLAQIGG